MWPSGFNPTNTVNVSSHNNSLNTASNYEPILTAGLQLIISDVGTFMQFAGNGSYSVPVAATYDNSILPGYEWNSKSNTFDPSEVSTAGYTGALSTYLISEAFAQNSVHAQPGKITTSALFQSGKTCTNVRPLLCVDEVSSNTA